ncbi:MAG: hypothetical protein JHD16_16435 [Solirubrobacteraceae bacterium]|nr:hypothetical protein [Solirubrobacteraceae bacterium]
MFRRQLTTPLLVAAILVSATAAPPAHAVDPFTKQIQAWQKQWNKQWATMVKQMNAQWQAQWKSMWTKQGINPTTPYVAKGFTVELPVGGPGLKVGGLGVNPGGTGAAIAVGSVLGGTGQLFLVDTLRQSSVEVPQSVTLPFDGSNALSLDGKRVVFLSGLGIFAKPYAYTKGAPTATPLSTKTTGQPSISSDGKTYAYATDGGLLGRDTVEIGDPFVGTPTVIGTAATSTTTFSRPQVSGDGRYIGWLSWTASKTEFKQYDKKTQTTVTVDLAEKGLPTGGSPVLADWSWDSRRLLVTRTTSGNRTAYLVDLKGTTRTVTTLPGAVAGESTPTLRADSAAVAVATPTPMDSSDTNNAVDLGWVNAAGTKYERQSIDAEGKQLPSGIGAVAIGGRVPRFAAADTAVAAFWVSPATVGGGESVYVRTTLPVPNVVVAPTTPPAG